MILITHIFDCSKVISICSWGWNIDVRIWSCNRWRSVHAYYVHTCWRWILFYKDYVFIITHKIWVLNLIPKIKSSLNHVESWVKQYKRTWVPSEQNKWGILWDRYSIRLRDSWGILGQDQTWYVHLVHMASIVINKC